MLSSDIEDFFPWNNVEIINNSIANTDINTLHDKIQKYDELDSEQRYAFSHPDATSHATCPYSSNS